MSYFPVLKHAIYQPFTTVYNFAPNNYEDVKASDKYLYAIYIQGNFWKSCLISKLSHGEFYEFDFKSFPEFLSINSIVVLVLSRDRLERTYTAFPVIDSCQTSKPAWRATIGLKSNISSCSYQGEINVFPNKATLLSMSPFFQDDEKIKNELILVNLCDKPTRDEHVIEIYDSKTLRKLAELKVYSNSVNIIGLNELDIAVNCMPIIIARTMSGIPLYLSHNEENSFMSLEHTHPPACYSVHGERWRVQKLIKEKWFAKTCDENKYACT